MNFQQVTIKHHLIPKGQTSFQMDNILSEAYLCEKLIMCFIEGEKVKGSYKYSPLECKHSWPTSNLAQEEGIETAFQILDALQRPDLFQESRRERPGTSASGPGVSSSVFETVRRIRRTILGGEKKH
jgi:hypothetical protein